MNKPEQAGYWGKLEKGGAQVMKGGCTRLLMEKYQKAGSVDSTPSALQATSPRLKENKAGTAAFPLINESICAPTLSARREVRPRHP